MDRYEFGLQLEKFLKIASVLGSAQAKELLRLLAITRAYPLVAVGIMEMSKFLPYFHPAREGNSLHLRVSFS
jgi:hypothetical protein